MEWRHLLEAGQENGEDSIAAIDTLIDGILKCVREC